jgi:uncharacterized membrane protein YcaP (DUF421 family)
MDTVLRGLVVYLVLLVVFRAAGKRSVAEITTFDFILLLLISEVVQEALVDGDSSMTNAFLLIITLVGFDILLSVLKQRWPRFDRWLDGSPLVVMADGKLLHERMRKARVHEADILSAARIGHGLERLDQIKFAVLERNGAISVVPKASSSG